MHNNSGTPEYYYSTGIFSFTGLLINYKQFFFWIYLFKGVRHPHKIYRHGSTSSIIANHVIDSLGIELTHATEKNILFLTSGNLYGNHDGMYFGPLRWVGVFNIIARSDTPLLW